MKEPPETLIDMFIYVSYVCKYQAICSIGMKSNEFLLKRPRKTEVGVKAKRVKV